MAVINGTSGNDTLNGGASNVNDALNGGLGNDTYQYNIGTGQDVIADTGGIDTLAVGDPNNLRNGWNIFRSGNDLIFDFNTQGRLSITGQYLSASAIETVTFGSGPSMTLLSGTSGSGANELIVGSTASEFLTGGGGDDIIFADSGNDTVFCLGGEDEIWGGAGNDYLYGGMGNDDIGGGSGADTIDGSLGWDEASYADQTAGVIVNISGQSQDIGGGLVLGSDQVFEKAGGTVDILIAVESIIGSKFADTFFVGNEGNSPSVEFVGMAGNDIVYVGSQGVNLAYWDDPSGIIANLGSTSITVNSFTVASNSARDGWGNTDIFFLPDGCWTAVNGSMHADYIQGSDSGSGWMNGDAGNDTLRGGITAYDTASYDNGDEVTMGIIANLSGTSITANSTTVAANQVRDGFGNTDTLTGIEGINGTLLNDYIIGSAGDNHYLGGGDGSDTIDGSTGTNSLEGGNGGDLFYSGRGNNSIDGGVGIDTVSYVQASAGVSISLASSMQIIGASNWDNLVSIECLTGSNYADSLTGDANSNVLNGGAGIDTMIGGNGSDTYFVDNALDVVTETNASASTGGTDQVRSSLSTYTLGNNVEDGRILASTAANLTGNTLNNVLYAGTGNNVLNGGTGTDTVSYAYGVSINTGVSVSLALATAQATGGSGSDTLASIENLTGSSYADNLTGNTAANILDGGTGADNLTGSDGSDTYVVDNALDVVTETNASASTGGTDQVNSYLGTYTLGNYVENGRIMASTAANLTGNTLNNVLYAGTGNNVLNGGTGADTVSYAYGVGGTTGVTVSLALATAQATGGSGSDTFAGIEHLIGSNYADTLTGSGGTNLLNGGKGNDSLTGGSGLDTFRFDTALGATLNCDTITDFSVADDTLQLENAIFTSLTATGALAADFFRSGAGVTTAADANDFLIYNSSTGALYYDAGGNGVTPAIQFASLAPGLALTAADFVVS